MQTDDPEAPTTIDERFDYGTFTGGDVTGSVVIDAGSIISLDPREPAEGSASKRRSTNRAKRRSKSWVDG